MLFETKTDMAPGGMAEMTGKISPLPADQPGIYRFQIGGNRSTHKNFTVPSTRLSLVVSSDSETLDRYLERTARCPSGRQGGDAANPAATCPL